jgi:hypothetical protein
MTLIALEKVDAHDNQNPDQADDPAPGQAS